MQRYESEKKTSEKSIKQKTMKIKHRVFGSTHASPTKERVARVGKKRARREATIEGDRDE